ncbi:DUF2381 family protein [Corallococcus macrosporus]|uniref:DUF2381 family protein n=1 Tax=Corallococcus macrosporus TaxID=35 RepID=A0ABS3DGU6_9BACT|nr:DUF2381 family protein [Corallococcus macrosporus]MBN8230539.1 DUF2381 family protein [Corallococcus macrosporus]
MPRTLPGWFTVLFVLVATPALAGPREKAQVRTLVLSEHPDDAAHRIHVAGEIVTVLRFEQPCDPLKTKLLGWEGRFEPVLVAGKRVVIEPLRALAPDESVPLLVTLADGSALSFLLRPPVEEVGRADQQVDVFKDRESYQALVSVLTRTLKAKNELEVENARLREEETSADHALAALLVSGAEAQTPFRRRHTWNGKDVDAQLSMRVYSGKGKAAVMLSVTNQSEDRNWRLSQTKLFSSSSRAPRTVAIRAERESIAVGQTGAIAFVVDRSAFLNPEGKFEELALEVYQHDGRLQAFVLLDPQLVRE